MNIYAERRDRSVLMLEKYRTPEMANLAVEVLVSLPAMIEYGTNYHLNLLEYELGLRKTISNPI